MRRIAVMGAIGLGILLSWRHHSHRNEGDMHRVPEPAPAAAVLTIPSSPPPAPRIQPEAIELPSAPVEASPWDVPTRKKAIFARRPELQRFVELKAKVLRSDEESRDYGAILSDAKRMATAKDDLLARGEKTFDESFQLQRMFQVSYLDAALSWRENPSRATALDSVVQVLRDPTSAKGMPVDLIKSITGDRIELMISLRGNDAEAADALHREVRGTPVERVLAAGERRAAMGNIGASAPH